jgi:hypothetical protein
MDVELPNLDFDLASMSSEHSFAPQIHQLSGYSASTKTPPHSSTKFFAYLDLESWANCLSGQKLFARLVI